MKKRNVLKNKPVKNVEIKLYNTIESEMLLNYCLYSSMVEQPPCKRQVIGSTPIRGFYGW